MSSYREPGYVFAMSPCSKYSPIPAGSPSGFNDKRYLVKATQCVSQQSRLFNVDRIAFYELLFVHAIASSPLLLLPHEIFRVYGDQWCVQLALFAAILLLLKIRIEE